MCRALCVQRSLLRHSARTTTNSELVNEGQMLETFSLVINVVVESAFKFPTSKAYTPRLFLLTSQNLLRDNQIFKKLKMIF